MLKYFEMLNFGSHNLEQCGPASLPSSVHCYHARPITNAMQPACIESLVPAQPIACPQTPIRVQLRAGMICVVSITPATRTVLRANFHLFCNASRGTESRSSTVTPGDNDAEPCGGSSPAACPSMLCVLCWPHAMCTADASVHTSPTVGFDNQPPMQKHQRWTPLQPSTHRCIDHQLNHKPSASPDCATSIVCVRLMRLFSSQLCLDTRHIPCLSAASHARGWCITPAWHISRQQQQPAQHVY